MQFGFKSGTGTLDAIFVLRTFMFYVTRVLKVPGFAVFIDLRKAFPSLSRVKTVDILRKKRVPEKLTRAVASLMSGSMQRLRVNGKLTDPFPVTSGTPEGSINSPEVFAMVYKEVLKKLDIHELPSDFALIQRGKVYYIIFADDLTFFSLDIEPLETRTNEFGDECVEFDMSMNRGKSKWMAFLPETTSADLPAREEWKIEVNGELLENVDEFVYLGYRLDVHLSDKAHVKMIKEKYIRAAQVVGQLMRDLQCVSLNNLRRFYLSLVFSQLYGLIFVDEGMVEFERGVGIFLKRSLCLPETFPHVVAMALLGVKHVKVFQLEQRTKFLVRWEKRECFPVFEALVVDRSDLFPTGVGLSANYGEVLADLDLVRTLDYCDHFRDIRSTLETRVGTEHRRALFEAEGRAFWTLIGPEGLMCEELKQVLSRLTFESFRIIVLLFADALCWTVLRRPSRSCPFCKLKLCSSHFFSCSHLFHGEHVWMTFVRLCQAGSWEDVVDLVFHILQKWVSSTGIFRDHFRLHVLEYENLCRDDYRAAFRWNI
jgi:hypothetical protein